MTEQSPEAGREEYEHIPWSQLIPETTLPLRRPIVIAAGVVIAVVLGFVGSRLLGSSPQPLPPASALPTPALATTDIVSTTAEVATAEVATAEVATPQLYREADLMAVLPQEEERLAVMRAEWFVTDYFTVDGPTDGDVASQQTYVEWARAYRIDGADPARYLVDVAYRLLAARESNDFTRLPLQAVQVVVLRDDEGHLAVGDLPRPVAPPTDGTSPSWPEPGVVPQQIAAEAIAMLAGLGLNGDVISGHTYEGGWRVIVSGAALGGPPFPLSLIVGDSVTP